MNFKQFSTSDNQWHDTPYYIMGTSTDTITTLPADIYANDNNATVGLVGNMQQSGTPTPQNPITPSETGDKTANLWDNLGFSASTITTSGIHSLSNTYGTSLSTVSGGSVDITQVASGGTTAYQNGYFFIEIDISQFSLGDNIVISFDYEITNKLSSTSTTVAYVGQGATGTNVIGNWGENGRAIIKATITSAMTRPCVEIRLCGNSIKVRNVQICLGSTALPYEPYGVKIPISSAGQTTPVYLGEVQSTRKIGKYIFTGDENITRSVSASNVRMYYVISSAAGASPLYCTHFVDYAQAADYPPVGYCNFNNISNFIMGVDGTEFETADDFKTWLRTQYTNGNPLTVWYVLATETTGIVNEPIRKIGDYADTVSDITIPTIAGANTVDVLTTLKPSEVSVNYHGWHPVQSVHERENGQWD